VIKAPTQNPSPHVAVSFGLCGGDLAGVGIDDLGGGLVLLRPTASPSMPLRKSTGRDASRTRTAPEGPITSWPSRHRSPPRDRARVGIAADPHHDATHLELDTGSTRPAPTPS